MTAMRYQSARPRPHHLPFRNGSFDPIDAAGIAALSAIIGDAELAPVWQRAAEPFAGITTDGARRFRIMPWLVNEGSVSVRLFFSGAAPRLVP
jgi:hypothetical protein